MTEISWLDLVWCFVPITLVCGIYIAWQGRPGEIIYASLRMIVQLVAVGYVLVSLFENPSPWLSLLIVSVMLLIASWIAIRPVRHHPGFLLPAVLALGISVSLHLGISLMLVLKAERWFQPELLIPLAGMYLANTMNAISLAAERYLSELENSSDSQSGSVESEARLRAFHAAMIPQINGLLAVGLVALPGMMTGQILSGVSPLVAVRYQVMIMAMILGTSGCGSALMLWLLGKSDSLRAGIRQ